MVHTWLAFIYRQSTCTHAHIQTPHTCTYICNTSLGARRTKSRRTMEEIPPRSECKRKRKTTAARPSLPPSTLTRGGGRKKVKHSSALHCTVQDTFKRTFYPSFEFFFFFTNIFIGHWSKGGVEATIGQKKGESTATIYKWSKSPSIGQHHTHATLTKTCFYFHRVLFSFLVRPYSFLFLWCTSRIM